MTAFDRARIEEASLNAMQSQRQLFYDGWLLKVSPGAAKRGRRVSQPLSHRRRLWPGLAQTPA